MAAQRSSALPAARGGLLEPAVSERHLQHTLTYRLHLLHKITDQESQRRYLKELDLGLSDGRCLATVGSFEPLSVNDLAKAANLNKGQASRAAQSLVERGLLEKTVDPADGRGVVLRLTEGGRECWAAVMELIIQRNKEIFGGLSFQQQTQLSELLDCLIRHAQQEPLQNIEAKKEDHA